MHFFVTLRGDTAVAEYAWQMTWAAGEAEHNDTGEAYWCCRAMTKTGAWFGALRSRPTRANLWQ